MQVELFRATIPIPDFGTQFPRDFLFALMIVGLFAREQFKIENVLK